MLHGFPSTTISRFSILWQDAVGPSLKEKKYHRSKQIDRDEKELLDADSAVLPTSFGMTLRGRAGI